MAATRNFAPLNTRTVAVCVLLVFTSSLISCSTATGPVATSGKTSSLNDGQFDAGPLTHPTVLALRVTGASPAKTYTPGSGEKVAVGTLKGAGMAMSACVVNGNPIGLVWFVVCTPVALVGGAIVGGAKTAHDLPSTPTSKSASSSELPYPSPTGMLAVVEEYAKSNGIPTLRLPSGRISKYQKRLPQTPAKLLDIEMVRVFYGSGEIRIETKIQVISLADEAVIDSYSFTARAAESEPYAETIRRAYLEIAHAALDESILVYRGVDGLSAAAKLSAVASHFPDYTLRPIHPKPANDSAAEQLQEIGRIQEVDSLQPSFQWERLPVRFDNDGGLANDIKNITYEFKLYRGQFVGTRNMVPREEPAYARKGLVEPSLALEAPLAPCTRYYWTVRAHFDVEGQPRVTEWTGAYEQEGVGAAPSSYRRNSQLASSALPTLAVLYPEFHTKGECATSVSHDDQPRMRMEGYLGGNK